jgi:predicted glutamine amidotransferase
MCELLGMSSSLPATLNLSLTELARHGGPPTLIRDGWGVAYYEGPDVRLIKDAGPADKSDWIGFLRDHPLQSSIIVAHIRKATIGERAYRNTQPFTRELAGRTHLFAHNGWLPGIFDTERFRSAHYAPVGETDSEQAFCGLLDRLQELWHRPGVIPPLDARLSVVSSFAAEMRSLGPANFLYSDGETLFAHGDRRKQAASAKVEPPGLVFLERRCGEEAQVLSANGVSVKVSEQTITLVASVPLTGEPWEALAEGEVIAISKGEVTRSPN